MSWLKLSSRIWLYFEMSYKKNLNKNKQYEVLIQDTKEEYFRWMDEREKVRKDIRKTLLQ